MMVAEYPKRWLTKTDVRRISGMSDGTFYRLKNAKIIRGYRPGPRMREKYDAAEITAIPGFNFDWTKLVGGGDDGEE